MTIVGVSDWIISEAKKSPLLSATKRFVRIYNWINHDVFYPKKENELREKMGLKNEDFVLLGVSQGWSDKKGLSFIIKLAIKHPSWKFILVGKVSCSLPNNIIPAGTLSDLSLLADYYSMADVLVNFSQQESFGKVAAEALSCGTPVIANNNTANPEIVGDCGGIIDNNDLEEFESAIDVIIKTDKQELSERCYKRSRSLFSMETNLGQYMKLFQELMCEKSKNADKISVSEEMQHN